MRLKMPNVTRTPNRPEEKIEERCCLLSVLFTFSSRSSTSLVPYSARSVVSTPDSTTRPVSLSNSRTYVSDKST